MALSGPSRRSIIEVIGSLNTDLVTITKRVPGPGETIAATSFSTGFGGKGANQAVAAARLSRESASVPPRDGVRVVMRGAVGDDDFGRAFLEHLDCEAIDRSQVLAKTGFPTGTSVIIVEEQTGENRILFNAGANGHFSAQDVESAVHTPAANQHYVLLQMEIPIDTLVAAVRRAKRSSQVVIVNTAPAGLLPDEVFDGLHYLVMNESEAALLSGVSESQIRSKLDEVASGFFAKGVQTVIITLGDQVSCTGSEPSQMPDSGGEKGVFFSEASTRKSGLIPAVLVRNVLDTTAAGDTFCGALALGLACHGASRLDVVLAFANKAASLAVQKIGAQTSMPFGGEV